jgi:hypothetical protein
LATLAFANEYRISRPTFRVLCDATIDEINCRQLNTLAISLEFLNENWRMSLNIANMESPKNTSAPSVSHGHDTRRHISVEYKNTDETSQMNGEISGRVTANNKPSATNRSGIETAATTAPEISLPFATSIVDTGADGSRNSSNDSAQTKPGVTAPTEAAVIKGSPETTEFNRLRHQLRRTETESDESGAAGNRRIFDVADFVRPTLLHSTASAEQLVTSPGCSNPHCQAKDKRPNQLSGSAEGSQQQQQRSLQRRSSVTTSTTHGVAASIANNNIIIHNSNSSSNVTATTSVSNGHQPASTSSPINSNRPRSNSSTAALKKSTNLCQLELGGAPPGTSTLAKFEQWKDQQGEDVVDDETHISRAPSFTTNSSSSSLSSSSTSSSPSSSTSNFSMSTSLPSESNLPSAVMAASTSTFASSSTRELFRSSSSPPAQPKKLLSTFKKRYSFDAEWPSPPLISSLSTSSLHSNGTTIAMSSSSPSPSSSSLSLMSTLVTTPLSQTPPSTRSSSMLSNAPHVLHQSFDNTIPCVAIGTCHTRFAQLADELRQRGLQMTTLSQEQQQHQQQQPGQSEQVHHHYHPPPPPQHRRPFLRIDRTISRSNFRLSVFLPYANNVDMKSISSDAAPLHQLPVNAVVVIQLLASLGHSKIMSQLRSWKELFSKHTLRRNPIIVVLEADSLETVETLSLKIVGSCGVCGVVPFVVNNEQQSMTQLTDAVLDAVISASKLDMTSK